MSEATHALCSDVTPHRCTVAAVGTEEYCRAAADELGDDDTTIMTIRPRMTVYVGDRATHADGEVWT